MSRNKKKRSITPTEYWGYKKYHKHIDFVLDREESKAKRGRRRGLKEQGKIKKQIKNAIHRGCYEEIDEFIYKEQEAIKTTYNVRGRLERRRLLEEYED